MSRAKKNLAIIFLVLQCLAFIFTIAGIPTAQISAGSACYTLWGYKATCSSSVYTSKGAASFGCLKRTNNMKSGAVGAVLGCVLAFVGVIGGILMVVGLGTGTFLATCFSLLAFTSLTLSWCCTVEVQRTPELCGLLVNLTGADLEFWNVGRLGKYAAGFALLVVGWVMQVGAVFVLMVYLGINVVQEEHTLRALLPAEEEAARKLVQQQNQHENEPNHGEDDAEERYVYHQEEEEDAAVLAKRTGGRGNGAVRGDEDEDAFASK